MIFAVTREFGIVVANQKAVGISGSLFLAL